mmetsp:Transcript_22965/g.36880  ORF Transcript_22965/g.36880 Transcript_22965/m.36880 type:complete len:129 (-) Transcript_22965:33-419(-)
MSPYQSPAPTALAPPGTYLAGGGPAAVSVGATEDAGPKVVIDVESVAFILNAELGPRWADADSETLRSHVRTHGIVLREKYRHLFRDAAVGPYVAVSYQWKALLGDILDQVNGALEREKRFYYKNFCR